MKEKIVECDAVDMSLDCPFCGGDAHIQDEYADESAYIVNYVCSSCHATGSARYDFTGEIFWSVDD